MTSFASVTDIPCSCGFLQRSAENPDLPIVFDRQMNEFHFEYPVRDRNAELIIHHCPFCGGLAPKSVRNTLFAVVGDQEMLRLNAVLAGIKTLGEAIEKLGAPDRDLAGGAMTTEPDVEARPPRTAVHRLLVYENLSETAVVNLTDNHGEAVGISFHGKYIGPKKPS